jgi:glycosyltransferase involved in cell wall biosynthesis
MVTRGAYILLPKSSVRKRMLAYGTLVDELHIITFNNKNPGKLLNQPIQISSNVWVYQVSAKYLLQQFTSGILTGFRVFKLLGKTKDSLVTAQDPYAMGVFGWLYSKLFNLPLQIQVHNDLFSQYYLRQYEISLFRQWVTKRLLIYADDIRVVSESIKNSLSLVSKKIKTEKISVLPVFVDIEVYEKEKPTFNLKQKYPQFDHIVLMAGRLNKQKNYPLALAVFKNILKSKPNTGLVILGDGVDENQIKKLASKYKLNKNVIFEGIVDDVASYYKGTDVFFHCADYEGYGLVLVEAAACGAPIVSTNVGVMAGMFEHRKSALIASVRNERNLEAYLLEMLNDKTLRDLMSVSALNTLKVNMHLTREQHMEEFKQSWERCLYSPKNK